MVNRAGRTPAELKTAHATARRYILKHMDATPEPVPRYCAWYACRRRLPDDSHADRIYCSGACRVAAHRKRLRA